MNVRSGGHWCAGKTLSFEWTRSTLIEKYGESCKSDKGVSTLADTYGHGRLIIRTLPQADASSGLGLCQEPFAAMIALASLGPQLWRL